MFVRQIALLGRPLAPHLKERLDSQESGIMRVTDPALLAPELVRERMGSFAVPDLLRDQVEFDTREKADQVTVRVKAPVRGDVQLLEFVPDGHEQVRISAKITDDLARGADQQGDSYSSDAFDKPSPDRRSGFVLTKTFPSSATAEEIREWARGRLDQVESYLPAMRRQVAAHEDHAYEVLADRAAARRRALTRASELKRELGKGV